MPTVDVFDMTRKKVGSLDLRDDVFGVADRDHVLYAMVRYQRAKARQGTHKVKTRSEVSGGGRKPWKQKGTGRARQGTTRAAQWRGGGVVFGPVPRSYAFKLNKRVRRQALQCALSKRMQDSRLFVLTAIDLLEIKTKHVTRLLEAFEASDALIVTSGVNESLVLSARNIPNVQVLPVGGLNVYDLLRRSTLILTKDAAEELQARLGEEQ